MADIRWTPNQQDAITRMGQGIAVSAAAGSGKTAVLTERCVYLVCDAPQPDRCNLDELTIVTFTDAAAAEMKTRIRTALSKRLTTHADTGRVREQIALVDAANISTLHAFCNRMVRQYFNHADIDPSAILLPDDEMRILQAESLDTVLNNLYASNDNAGATFQKLVDIYGLGSDQQIAQFVIRLSNFLDSLPDPDQWLAQQRTLVTGDQRNILRDTLQALATELSIQCEQNVVPPANTGPEARVYFDETASHLDRLRLFSDEAQRLLNSFGLSQQSAIDLDALLTNVRDHNPKIKSPPRLSADTTPPETIQQRDRASAVFKKSRTLFQARIQTRFTLFTTGELIEGITAIAPFVTTIVDLVQRFRDQYTITKRRKSLLEFADLERLTLNILTNDTIATTIRQRFAHILVDEYQDINPIQHAILQHISREGVSTEPSNLFTVGDVKQSIYGFRSADPDVFQQRLAQGKNNDRQHTIHLQENFRSRPHVIDAINRLFANLMHPGVVGMDYDDTQQMSATRPPVDPTFPATTDIHFLERDIPHGSDNDSTEDNLNQPMLDPDDPAEWETIEREAYLIAMKIRHLTDNGMTREDGTPLRPADVAILLRSGIHSANTIASVLEKYGIPTATNSETNLLESVEIRDVVAALQIIDNSQQDIPLAATLRSHILGLPFTEDDLAAIRISRRTEPFHEAAFRFPDRSSDHPAAQKLATFWKKVDRCRREFRERSIHDTLWKLITDTGFLAYVGGLPNGSQRRGNLFNFHQRTASFSDHKRATLHDFLCFVDQLAAREKQIRTSARSANPDGVSIMTIHAAKGLEFPVVFIADLARSFNLSDARGRFTFDRHAGIGLNVIDREKRIEYPSARSQIVANSIHRHAIAEEIRILYVAMTRARDKLILIATPKSKFAPPRPNQDEPSPVSMLDILSANNYSDWITASLRTFPPNIVSWPDHPNETAIYRVHAHGKDDITQWDTARPSQQTGPSPTQLAVAQLKPLPPDEPRSDDPTRATAILERIECEYPCLAASSIRSVVAASEANYMLDPFIDPDEITRAPAASPRSRMDRETSASVGIATHKLMQHLDFNLEHTVRVQLDQLTANGILNEKQSDLINVDAIEWFLMTDLAVRIRQANSNFHREFMFLATQAAYRFDETLPESLNDGVLVRGVVDGILVGDACLDIIDYKTDRIQASNVDEVAQRYRSQMQLYATSVESLFNMKTKSCHLVFLHPRIIVDIIPPANKT